jgi:mRNA interferase MazF
MKSAYKKYKAGDIVLVKFPFTNQVDYKIRPALIMRDQDDIDVTILPISTTLNIKPYDIVIKKDHYKKNPLPVESVIRIGKICTIESTLVVKKFDALKKEFFEKVQTALIWYLNGTCYGA